MPLGEFAAADLVGLAQPDQKLRRFGDLLFRGVRDRFKVDPRVGRALADSFDVVPRGKSLDASSSSVVGQCAEFRFEPLLECVQAVGAPGGQQAMVDEERAKVPECCGLGRSVEGVVVQRESAISDRDE